MAVSGMPVLIILIVVIVIRMMNWFHLFPAIGLNCRGHNSVGFIVREEAVQPFASAQFSG